MKAKNVIGMILGIIGLTFCLVWFGWKLALVIFLMLIGNNLEQRK